MGEVLIAFSGLSGVKDVLITPLSPLNAETQVLR